MQRVAWIVGLLAVSQPVIGADLFRCIDRAGAVSWQDAPCGEGARLTTMIDVPEADPETSGESGASAKTKSAKSKRLKSAASPANRNPVGGSSGRSAGATRDGRSRQRETCNAARVERDRKLDALGLNRTFHQLRALDDKVQAACNGL